MTWEQPGALWLLLAILLLLFARSTTPRQRIAVANLFLWADLESRTASALSRRLRRHWLLILQAAFIAVAVATLARPLVSSGGHRIAIVLDVSMSMGAGDGRVTRLETAKAQASSLVEHLPRGGRATIWLAGSEIVVLGEFARPDAALERALQPLRATDAATNLEVAVEQARAADPAVSRIHVVSDIPPPEVSDVGWVPVGTRADNAAVTSMAARRSARDGTVALLVAVRNYGVTELTGDVVITRATSILARRTLHLAAAAESNIVFEFPELEGVVAARLETADALPADNTRFALVAPATPLRALLIGRNHWVEEALAVHPDVVTIVAASPGGGAGTEPDLVICASCAEVPAEGPHAGVLLVPPAATSPRESSTIIVTNATHPLLRGVNADGALVSPIGDGELDGEARVLAHAATLPVIVVREHDRRRIVELRIDPAASAITSEVAFPLFIANAVEWLAAPRRGQTALVAGEPLRHSLHDGAGNAVIVTGPDGRLIPARRVGDEIIAGDTSAAGVYHVKADGRGVEFVVNPAVERESDLSVAPPDAAPTAPAEFDARPSSVGITRGLLLTALALLALEWRHRAGERGR